MLTIPVYLYSNRIDVFFGTLAPSTSERYRKVYNRNLKVYRGSDNRIEFRVLNGDQKPRNISGLAVVFNLVSRDSQELVLKKDCVIQSADRGRCFVLLTESELTSIEQGFYQYSLVSENRTAVNNDEYKVDSRIPLYADSQYGVSATLEVFGDISGEAIESTIVETFNPRLDFNTGITTYFSSIIDARPELSIPQSNHTFQIYLDNYSGEIKIQGSLEAGGDPFVWSDIETLNYINQDSVFRNIVGKWNHFRITYLPKNGTNSTIDKIVYR